MVKPVSWLAPSKGPGLSFGRFPLSQHPAQNPARQNTWDRISAACAGGPGRAGRSHGQPRRSGPGLVYVWAPHPCPEAPRGPIPRNPAPPVGGPGPEGSPRPEHWGGPAHPAVAGRRAIAETPVMQTRSRFSSAGYQGPRAKRPGKKRGPLPCFFPSRDRNRPSINPSCLDGPAEAPVPRPGNPGAQNQSLRAKTSPEYPGHPPPSPLSHPSQNRNRESGAHNFAPPRGRRKGLPGPARLPIPGTSLRAETPNTFPPLVG